MFAGDGSRTLAPRDKNNKRHRVVDKLAGVIAAFPGQALAIRRLYLCDPDFRAACDDYADAAEALQRWRGVDARAVDYREIVLELEQEITAILERHAGNAKACGEGDSAGNG